MTTPPPITVPLYQKDYWPPTRLTTLTCVQPGSSSHIPTTSFATAWTSESIYVYFSVQDRYVCTRHLTPQSPVCQDSCVEFFFSPGPDIQAGYFNLEMNAAGTVLLHFQPAPKTQVQALPKEALHSLTISTSLTSPIAGEHTAPLDWNINACIPLDILRPYCNIVAPHPGALWRGNFYKCADHSSYPHWLSWAPIETKVPQFHRPDAFGTLAFSS